MDIKPFKLEHYFARYEFNVKFLLSSSDCESLSLSDLLEMAPRESLELWQNLKLGYTESAGHPLLRAQVASGYANINSDDVLIAAPEELIFIAMHSLLKAGDHIIALSPAYQSLHEIARSIGCDVSFWQLEPDPAGWSLDINKLEELITPRTRLLVLNFPNNPTGFLPTRAEFDAILALAEKNNLFIFSDEMYRQLEFEPAIRLPSLSDVYEKGLALSGLSKSYALPGLRIGWLTTRQNKWMEAMLGFKYYTTICNSAPSEILAIIALQNTDKIVTRNLEIIRGNLRLAEQFFQKFSNQVTWTSPQAGSIAFPKWHGKGTVEEFCQGALDQQGVMIVPGSLFDDSSGHFRIGLGRRNFAEALEYLDGYLSSI